MMQTALPGSHLAETPYQGARPYRPISARLDRLYIRYPRLFLMFIVAAYLVAASLFAITTPAWQNPDEPAHYNNIATIASGNGLPVLHHGDYDQGYMDQLINARFPAELPIDSVRYEAYQPPLYYIAAVPAYLLAQGSLLTLRLFSVSLGAFVIILLYLCAELVFPNKPLLSVGAAAFAAFLPMQVAMSAAVNNDGLAQLLLLAAMLILLRWLRHRFYGPIRHFGDVAYDATRTGVKRGDWPMLLLLGLLLGLGMLTKIYAYVALVLCAGMVGLTVWMRPRAHARDRDVALKGPSRSSFLRGIQAMLWVVVPAILVVIPLWLRNVDLYGAWDILGLRYHDAVVVGQPTTADWLAQNGSIAYSERAMTLTFRSFWGAFGWLSVFMDSRIYFLLLVFTAIVLCGLLWSLVRFISGRPETDLDRFQFWILGFFMAFLLAVIASYAWYNLKFVQHQGRYLLWGLLPISIFIALGWREVMQPLQGKVTGFLLGLLAVLMLMTSLFVPFQDRRSFLAMATLAALLFLQPFLLSGAVDAIIIGSPQLLQRWLRRPALQPALAVLRVLAWATPFVMLFLLDLMIPLWYIGPQLGP
jgi:4-amino-4-deoxy-L-arabinose transferase-like glycosyltransferase